MKLLFDQNLSPRLPHLLGDCFPGSSHVSSHGLASAKDSDIWDFAKAGGYAIVTKDVDFSERPVVLGFPPKVIWLKRGNCPAIVMESILRRHAGEIVVFLEDQATGLMVIQ